MPECICTYKRTNVWLEQIESTKNKNLQFKYPSFYFYRRVAKPAGEGEEHLFCNRQRVDEESFSSLNNSHRFLSTHCFIVDNDRIYKFCRFSSFSSFWIKIQLNEWRLKSNNELNLSFLEGKIHE